MSNVRDLFKPTSVSTLKKQVARVQQAMYGKKTGYLKLNSGKNVFRIFPSHPNTKTNNFIFEKVVHWLPQIQKQDDGTEKVERRTVFNSRIHGGTEKDIVDEYVKFVVNKVKSEVQELEEQNKLLYPILNWKNGITAKTSWVCYANKIVAGEKEFGLLNITNGVREELTNLSITEDSEEAIVVDPFTHPETGKEIMILYNPDAKKAQDYYKVTLLWQKDSPLTEEELNEFLKVDSLESMFYGVYTRKHFERAVAGLQIIDKDFGAFEDPDFIEIVREIDAYYPEDDEDADAEEEVVEEAEEDVEVDEEEVFQDASEEEVVEEEKKAPKPTPRGTSRISQLKKK